MQLDFQLACDKQCVPSMEQFISWLNVVDSAIKSRNDGSEDCNAMDSAIKSRNDEHEVTIRIVSPDEMQELNKQYRHKDAPTNVLAFPLELPATVTSELLGDIVICAEVVNKEAKDQNKTTEQHWAHITIHGLLHLLGYDHQTDAEAQLMEQTEIDILASLGYPNPY